LAYLPSAVFLFIFFLKKTAGHVFPIAAIPFFS